ncbi:MAG TPA: peptidyl-prolyl cis-trans isomerase [Syntrophales bacterium]|nr:peptidyl-prolyl cis-trans isomerase [Syntrophales bacterium]HQI36301.1 peptidyl-prolyl cis-trans isomerase [Syntrophales bacterium]
MKKSCLIMAAAILICATVVPATGEVVDRIVAIVNDDVITLSELNDTFDPFMRKIEANLSGQEKERMIGEGKKTILNRMIDGKLIEQEAKKSALTVKDEEVMGVIKDILKSRNIQMADLMQALAKDGLTLEGYKQELRGQLLRQRLIRKEIRAKIVITDEEIGDYYRRHRDEYEGKEAVRLKQILIPVPAVADDFIRRRAREVADGALRRIKGGESFEAVAVQYAQGSAGAAGGDIGFVEKGSMLPEVEKIALSLDIGAVSPVIESPQGFYIIQVVDKRGAGLKPITEVRQEIRMKLEDEKAAKKFEEWIAELRAKSLVEVKL